MRQRIRELMAQDLRTLGPDANCVEAARVMRDANIGDVLLVNEDGSLAGMVTDRDIVIRALAEGRDPNTCTLRDVASTSLATISADADASEAVRMMRERAIRRIPVCEGNKPVGVVSIGDLVIERDADSALADISAAPGNT